jgi:hypothetical protein
VLYAVGPAHSRCLLNAPDPGSGTASPGVDAALPGGDGDAGLPVEEETQHG